MNDIVKLKEYLLKLLEKDVNNDKEHNEHKNAGNNKDNKCK